MSDTITETTHGVKLSDPAADKVRSLLEQEGRDDLRLRVAVQPGGCSGLIYQLYFDERLLDGDAVVDYRRCRGRRRQDERALPRRAPPSTSRTRSRSRASRSTTPTRRAAARAATRSTEPYTTSPKGGRESRPPFVVSADQSAVPWIGTPDTVARCTPRRPRRSRLMIDRRASL